MENLPQDPVSGQRTISNQTSELKLVISVGTQILAVMRDGHIESEYPVSTSRFGLGTEPGSLKTPLGKFRIFEKIGDDAPVGAIFVGRKMTGETSSQGGNEDRILTRILWLEGCDPDNANTRERYIYLHGTNQESQIGTPASHGCIRMKSGDLIDLYALAQPGTPVEIVV